MFANRPFQRFARNLYRSLIHWRAVDLRDQELRRSAIVFAPHFDDETLGCGGTIIRKKRLGAELAVVFMTDGSASHNSRLSAEQLKVMRQTEALGAARVLGVNEADVYAFNFADSGLSGQAGAATERVLNMLRQREPQEVYLPYCFDRTPDHVATNLIVATAVQQAGRPLIMYEYPIWFWDHWPWSDRRFMNEVRARRMVRDSVRAMKRVLTSCRSRVDIADVAVQKRAALDQHVSQMCRVSGDESWPTLRDVWDGAFLECFFQKYELFVRRAFVPAERGCQVHNTPCACGPP